MLEAVEVPAVGPGEAMAHLRFAVHERPAATVSAWVRVADGRVAGARVAAGSVGVVPVRLVIAGLARDVAEEAELLHAASGWLGAAAGHPALAVAQDATAGLLHRAHHGLVVGVRHEARVGHDPERRRALNRHERAHLGARVEADPVVVVRRAVMRDRPVDPELAQLSSSPSFEDVEAPVEVEPDRFELTANARLRVAGTAAEDGAPARDDVERRPFEREVERVAR